MITSYILSLFLYFPEDKSEYFPAVITMLVFLIVAVFTMRWIIKYSKKEAENTKALEEKIMNQQEIDSYSTNQKQS
jgi:phosphotransferase system  glucose/maltose/N-acetylglucosamine-specific IIC component